MSIWLPTHLLPHLSLCSDPARRVACRPIALASFAPCMLLSTCLLSPVLALPFLLPQAATLTPLPSPLFPPCLGTYAVIQDLSPSLLLVHAPCCHPRKAPPALKVLFLTLGPAPGSPHAVLSVCLEGGGLSESRQGNAFGQKQFYLSRIQPAGLALDQGGETGFL